MENLIFSLNATIPVFFTMLMGLFFRRIGLFDEALIRRLNQFVFKAALPVLLFLDISGADFYQVWDTSFVLFCFLVTLLSISLAAVLSLFIKNKSIQGEFIQAAYRSSAAILGIAFIQNIYGNAGMAPLMIIGSVPLYNIMAVLVLSFFQPERGKLNRQLLIKTGREILTNPIILGIVVGLIWSVFKLPRPQILLKTANNLSVLATPLGLMAMGASFDLKKALSGLGSVMLAGILKLIGLACLFLPIAIALGFRESYLVAILVMLGSPTTVSCYIMAKNMGHEGSFTSAAVMLTTLLSAFTLTGWLYLLRSLGLI
ncbi:MAG: AEC family transporter [Lachnospiraceae bacterium]|nr:AEC family transporter [Lachnospiraceae bacterium]